MHPAQGQYHCASNIISNSHAFHSKWVDPPIPGIQQFQYFTMKIQGLEGHGWGQSLKSQCKCNILSTRIPFVPCQRALPFLRYSIFKIWPWKSKVNVIPEGHIVGTTPYQLISLSFDVDEPSHSYLLLLKKFDLENPRSRSWLGWTLKVTPWVQHSIDSHPFCSKSISHPIPEIQHFQTLTLKIQGQGHGWGKCWKSQHGSNIISTHTSFVPCQSAIPFLRYNFFFKFDLENPRSWSWLRSKLKITKWV